MSSNYLWKLYLENDAEAFRRLLLEGTLPSAYRGVGPGKGSCLEKKSSQEDIDGNITVSTSWKSSNITGQSLRRQKDIKLSFNRQSLRDYDSRGRSLLHLAATDYDGTPFLRALLRHPQLDIAHPDIESGWTALHRALYNGNITTARLLLDTESERLATGGVTGGGMLVKTKDRSGESPFELFHASIEGYEASMHKRWIESHQLESNSFGTEDMDESDEDDVFNWRSREIARRNDRLLRSSAGDEVFAFGSNKNLTLGFGDEDDRQFPERVPIQRPQQLSAELSGKESYSELSAMEAFKPLDILDIQLSKLHSAIVTSDPHNNLYICGFGHGGRLGLGEEQLTQFTYKNVSIANNPYTAIKVALGLDHTVVVLRNGEVWTWGMNRHGQLGYMTGKPTAGGANTGNTTGKHKKGGQVPSGLEESEFIQPTPRRVTDTIKRETIIGCAASRIHTVLHTLDTLYVFGKNEGQLGILESSDLSTPPSVPKKVVAGFLADHTISSVAAGDRSTVVMLETHDVWIFANYGYARVIFPVQRFFSNPDTESAIYKAANKRSHELNYISKITTGGDMICGLTSMGDVYTVNVGEFLKSGSTNNKVALPAAQRVWSRKKSPMAAKDVDIGQDGSIILCTASGSVWRRVKRTKANELHSGYTVNAGVANSTPFTTESKSKDYKFSRVPGLTRIISVRSNKFGAYAAIRKDCTILQTQLQVERPISVELLPPHLHGLHSILNIQFWKKYGIESLDHTSPKKWRNLLASVDAETCDMTIRAINSNFTIPVHKAIVLARCNILPRKLKELGSKVHVEWEKGVFSLTRDAHGLRLDIKEDFNVVMLLIIDIYALSVLSGVVNHGIGTRVSAIGNLLQVIGHEHLQRSTYRAIDAKVDLSEALRDPLYTAHGDMIVQLAGGKELRVYSTLLRLKSPFFETLFKGSANGQWIESRLEQMKLIGESAIKVDMTHVSWEIFQVVLDYIYSGNDNLLQEVRGIHDVDKYLDFLLDVLAVADELMMDDLSKICQKIMGFYVNTRNAGQLLKAIAPCSQKSFKRICLQYMCFNLETMLENHLLDDLDDWIMDELDETVRNMQRQCSIHSRCQAQEMRLLDKYPDMIEGSMKERQGLIASYAELIEANQGKDDTTQSGSQKHKAINSGPAISTTPRKQKKKTTKDGPLVNAEIHRSNSGGIFEMEDTESIQGTPAKKLTDNSAPYLTYVSPPSSIPYGGGAGVGWLGVRNDESPSFGVDVFNTSSFPPSGITISAASPETPPKPWKDTSTSVTKLDMKEIMSQAAVTSKRQSNLSLGLSSAKGGDKMTSPVATPTPKLSQKEKRRLQQEQQRQQPVVPSTPEKAKPSPWATPTQGPRIALRDVLADSNQPSAAAMAASPSPVMAGSPVQMRSTQPPPAQSRASASPAPHKVIPSKVERISPHTPSTPTSSSSNQPPPPTSKTHQPPRPQPPPPARPSFLNPPTQSKPTPPAVSSTQAFPSLPSSSSSPRQAEPTLQLSLADIIEQQEAEQAFLKGKVEKRNLEDIQAEQEFLEWWEKESERMRMEAEGAAGEGSRGGRGGKRGGRGGRGRGRKNAGGEGRGGNDAEVGARRGGGGEGGRGGRGMGRGRGEKRGRGTNKGQSSVTPAQGVVIR